MFKKPVLTDKELELGKHSGYQSDHTYEDNAQKIALENLRTQREALQHTLDLMWKTMLLSGVSIIVAVIAVAIAVISLVLQ